ncbi:protein of unknown function DUF610 YibQ [Desulfohalobium retbaense DSM 5692]|uniref:Divergent polysaccharide deacetylase family protein n=1 Tax=Desulfohalobium retbaense (strain ATCC 49708 / DSM 5692 / JCM 16813 / HR100) TaxID=485915 RepID=C8X4U7_DESRD|nr:protein of unknown function DUF610 YibQ [Desulfohalobium retbaense DSM 5692]
MATGSSKKSSRRRGKAPRQSKSRITVPTRLLTGLALLVSSALLLTVALFLLPSPKQSSTAQTPETAKRQYEETILAGLEQTIGDIDHLLLDKVRKHGLELRPLRVENRTKAGQHYHFQELTLRGDGYPSQLTQALGQALHNLEHAQLQFASQGTWEIKTFGVMTHRLHFSLQDKAEQNTKSQARLAIVIDDLGEDVRKARRLIQTGLPLTFAVLPSCTHTRDIASLAHEHNLELLLHQPMEPLSYPATDPGTGALFVGMNASQIRKTLKDNLAQIQHAVGLNNHMGSRFTSSSAGMRTTFRNIANRQLFFLDSLTSPDSVARETAKRTHVPYLRRNIFLDNTQNREAILYQLQKAERLALSRGSAIAIGHPYEATLEAIAKWKTQRDPRVRLIPLSTLLAPTL